MADADRSPKKAAVFFDVDGTLIKSTIVHYFIYFMRRRMSPVWYKFWYAAFLLKCPFYIVLDKFNRTKFNIVFYKGYRGLSCDEIKSWAPDCYQEMIKPRMFTQILECVESHRASNRRIVLVTGSIDFIMKPLADALRVNDVIAPALVEANGRFTGELNCPPVSEKEKANRIRIYAQEHDIDLSLSYAYGDSVADLPMLECVGNPHVVNPDKALTTIATARDWPALHWTIDTPQENRAHEGAAIS